MTGYNLWVNFNHSDARANSFFGALVISILFG